MSSRQSVAKRTKKQLLELLKAASRTDDHELQTTLVVSTSTPSLDTEQPEYCENDDSGDAEPERHAELMDENSSSGESDYNEEWTSPVDETTKTDLKLTLGEELLMFMLIFCISRRAMSYLLKILTIHGVDVPRSVYLLQKGSRRSFFRDSDSDIGEGNFAHRSLSTALEYLIDGGYLLCKEFHNLLSISLNVDGLPLFKGSRLGLWTILLTIKNCSYPKPIPLGVFCGIGKPRLQPFVKSLVEELDYFQSGFKVLRGKFVRISDVFFICDAPARAFLQCIKSHTAKLGCGYCRKRAEYVEDRVCFRHFNFDSIASSSRTNEMYASNRENNQRELSPLAHLVPLRDAFLPEYMHSVCLGVVKRLCSAFISKKKNEFKIRRLNAHQLRCLSERIDEIRFHMPKEFNRPVRPIGDFSHYRATEFRSILLYIGPIVFKGILPKKYYKHFMYLHFAMYAFASPVYCNTYFAMAKECIGEFCSRICRLYGQKFYSYNCHLLMHLPEFVSVHGCLDSWSAFVFENYLGILKRRLKCTRGMFQHTKTTMDMLVNLSCHGSDCSGFQYGTRLSDQFAMLYDRRILMVTNVNTNDTVSGWIMNALSPLYVHPRDSLEAFRIGRYGMTQEFVFNVKLYVKCFALPHENEEFTIIPLVHPCLVVK